MKHSIPKGDKKKKKEVTAGIAQMLADVDSKHEREMKEFEGSLSSTEKSGSSKDNVKKIEAATSDIEIVSDVVKDVVEDASKQASDITEGDKSIKEGGNAVKEGIDVLKKSSDVLKESSDVIVEGRNVAEEELKPIKEIADITKEEGEISKEGVSEKNIVESVAKRRKITVSPSASATTSPSPSDSPAKEDKPVEKKVNVPMQRRCKNNSSKILKRQTNNSDSDSIISYTRNNLSSSRASVISSKCSSSKNQTNSFNLLNKETKQKLMTLEDWASNSCIVKPCFVALDRIDNIKPKIENLSEKCRNHELSEFNIDDNKRHNGEMFLQEYETTDEYEENNEGTSNYDWDEPLLFFKSKTGKNYISEICIYKKNRKTNCNCSAKGTITFTLSS